MSDSVSPPQTSGLGRYVPLALIIVGAVLTYTFFRDYLSFQALADNREALIAFRDSNYLLTAAVFVAIYALIVAFSLPGATIATLTGGFLFATSQKMLTQTLRELEEIKLVNRIDMQTVPPHVEYQLTELGLSLREKICAIDRWIEENMLNIIPEDKIIYE